MDSPIDPSSNNPYPNGGEATIAPPAFNAAGTKLELEAKSVKNVSQAANICKGLEYNNRQRCLRASDLQELHDGRPPKGAVEQREKAKAWEANFSSLWLAGIVGRVSQRFVNAIISQTYCTASALPSNTPDAKTKTDSLRAGFTSLVRGWDGNTSFINAVAMETVLQGYAYACFLDPHTWHPTFFKQTECFVPEQSGQHARELQFFAAKRDFRLDKFIELFRDEKAAEDNGYVIQNCFEAANKAVMRDPRDDAATTDFRKFADMINEGSIGLGVSGSGERVVKTWLLFTREYDGQVSFWLIQRDSNVLLRFSHKLFRRMQDVMAMFSFEAGNGCIHSSKGLGRKLAALTTVKELFRCGIVDNARMGGMMVIGVDASQKTKFAPAMMAPFILVDKSAVDLKEAQQFQVSAEGYQVIDTLIDSWAEQAVGAYLAAQITDKGKAERTATEATIDARRENEAADIMIRRCLDQDANRIQMQQLRVCSDANLKRARAIFDKMVKSPDREPESFFPEDIDDANLLRFLVGKIEEGITDEEIRVWSKSPASMFAHVTEGAVQRGISMAKQKYSGNPNIDQGALDYADLEGMVGADMAKKLFIPKADETLAIEAGRQQMIESFTMGGTGEPIKASPRDNHLIHGAVMVQFLTNSVAPLLSDPNAPEDVLKVAELNTNHLAEHLALGAQQGLNKQDAFKELEKFYEGWKKQLGEVIQIREEARVAQELVSAQVRAEDAVPAVPAESGTVIPGDFEAPVTDPNAPVLAQL